MGEIAVATGVVTPGAAEVVAAAAVGPSLSSLCVATLGARNPDIHEDVLRIFVDALKLYAEASDNIAKNGALCGHPKTGAPMVNPYVGLRDKCARTIAAFHARWPKFDDGSSPLAKPIKRLKGGGSMSKLLEGL